MYQEPKRLFVMELLGMIFGFLGFGLLAALSGLGNVGIVFGIVVNALLLLAIFVFAVMAWWQLFRHLLDKERSHTTGIRLINVLFGSLVFLGFAVLYLVLILAGSVLLLPLIQ
jgi:hypothetical protein